MCLSSIAAVQPCLIVSLGSAGQYEFEESMLQSTECKVRQSNTAARHSLGPAWVVVTPLPAFTHGDGI